MKYLIPVLLSLIIFLALTGCQGSPTSTPSSVPLPSATLADVPSATVGSTPILLQTETPDSPTAVRPAFTATPAAPHGSLVVLGVGAPSREITSLPEFVSAGLFDSLLTVNPQDGSLQPGLAFHWVVSDDSKSIEFVLRDGVTWHDGTPLTADDVVFTLKTLSDPNLRLTPAADFGPIADITAPDARTVRVTFTQPYCAALTYLGMTKILPKHRLEGKDLSNVAPSDLVGTGPLKLDSWNDSEINFSANPKYWRGAPKIIKWTYRIVPDAHAAEAARQDERADVWVGEAGAAPPSLAYNVNEFFALAMNNEHPPFDNPQVRQAIAAALNRADWLNTFSTEGLETSLLPAFWANPTGVQEPAFDTARARQLLASAGWSDTDGDGIVDKGGKPLEVALWAQEDDARSETAAQLARAELEKIGVRAILKLDDRTLFLTRVFLHEYDLAVVHLNIPLDPDQRWLWSSSESKPGFGLNVTGFKDAQVEQALTAGNQVAKCDASQRKAAYAPVFSQLASEVPMVFMFAPLKVVNATDRLSGLAPSSFAGPYWNLNTWEVAP